MADFQSVMKERKRMCNKIRESGACTDCPISANMRHNKGVYCLTFTVDCPEEAEELIMKWSAEHPIMTNGAKFEEIFGVPFWATSCGVTSAISQWLKSEYKELQEREKGEQE